MYRYLTFDDRKQIEKMLKAGYKPIRIAAWLGFSQPTIYNELRRVGATAETYSAVEAQKKVKRGISYAERIQLEEMLAIGTKSEIIAVKLGISRSTIYNETKRSGIEGSYSGVKAQKSLRG